MGDYMYEEVCFKYENSERNELSNIYNTISSNSNSY